MLTALKNHLNTWLFRLGEPESGSIVLVQRRIFILPSRHGVLFVCALLLMLTGAINYNLNLGFVLTFLLTAMGVNSILHTFRNLSKLRISPERTQPVFAGVDAQFPLTFEGAGTLDRYSVGITRDKKTVIYADVPAGQSSTVTVDIPALQRGLLRPGRVTLFTYYPIGLCYAWAYINPEVTCLVYPRPEPGVIPLPLPDEQQGQDSALGLGNDDFAGLRNYHPGDSPRHIAWKAAARGQGLLTKQFIGLADRQLWLDWTATPETLGIEDRLSRLTRWICDAHAAGITFGLRIPGLTLPPASGSAQRDRCLEALALFQGDSENNAHADR